MEMSDLAMTTESRSITSGVFTFMNDSNPEKRNLSGYKHINCTADFGIDVTVSASLKFSFD